MVWAGGVWLMGSSNLESGLNEAMIAFSHARQYGQGGDGTLDLAMARAIIEYYARVADVLLHATNLAKRESNNFLLGIGLAGLSFAMGSASTRTISSKRLES